LGWSFFEPVVVQVRVDFQKMITILTAVRIQVIVFAYDELLESLQPRS